MDWIIYYFKCIMNSWAWKWIGEIHAPVKCDNDIWVSIIDVHMHLSRTKCGGNKLCQRWLMLWVYIKTLCVSIRITRCINRNMTTSPSAKNDARDHFNIKGNVSKYKRAITVEKTASKQQTLWCHETETFSALLALCKGTPPFTRGFPHKVQ